MQVHQKARPQNERQRQFPPIPDTGGEFWGCTWAFWVNHLAATPTLPMAERASRCLSHCIPASDSNAAGRRDASGISQMSFSLPPPAFPGGTVVPPFPIAPTSHAAARLAVQTQRPLNKGCCKEGSSVLGLSPPVMSFSQGRWMQFFCTSAPFESPSAKTISALRGEQRPAPTSIIKVKLSTQVIRMDNLVLQEQGEDQRPKKIPEVIAKKLTEAGGQSGGGESPVP